MSQLQRHIVSIYRESIGPRQWLGICSCGIGTRCNSREAAEAFLRQNGCLSSRERT